MAGHVAHIGGRSDIFRFLLGKPEGRRPIGRSGHEWKYKIRVNLQHVVFGMNGLACSGSGKGQLAGTCECGNEPSGSINSKDFPDWLRTV